MTLSYEATARGYANLWEKAQVRPSRLPAARTWATIIGDAQHRPHYTAVEKMTGVPWFLVGLLDMRESSAQLRYLGDGESLNRKTVNVPRSRGPFSSFEAGAKDALELQHDVGIRDWPISRILWAAEEFNGLGYYSRGVNSPYLWSWSSLYSSGKYTSDSHYDPMMVDPQPGVATILKVLIEINPDVAAHFQQHKEPSPVTTPAPAPVPVTLNITQMISTLEALKGFIPMVLPIVSAIPTIGPPFAMALTLAVPIAEEGLTLIQEVEKNGFSLNGIGSFMSNVGAHMKSASSTGK